MTQFALRPTQIASPAAVGFGTRATNAAFGGLGTLGAILDTPGSVVRGVLNSISQGGEDFERIFTGIFDPSERVSGTELLGGDPDEFTFGGFVAEVLTDPTTYLTIGAKTVAGELAKRGGKLQDTIQAQRSLAKIPGATGTQRRLGQSLDAQASVQKQLTARGRDPGERLAKSIREQFQRGQRSLVQLDVPFTKLRGELVNNAAAGRVVGSIADTAAAAATENPISREIRSKFVTTRKNPVEEALRKEINIIVRGGTQEARRAGHDLQRKRLLLQAKDPDVDFKLIRILEEAGDELDLPLEPQTGFARITQVEKMIKARVRVEELYGEVDNFDDVWGFAQQIRRINKELLDSEQLSGVAVTPFTEFGYVARILTSQGAELLRESKKGRETILRHFNKLDAGSSGSFQHARNFTQLGIEDLNVELATAYGKDPKSFRFFDTDVVSIQVNRMLSSAKQIGRARFSQAAVDLFGVERSAKLIKRGNQVGAEKLLSPRGPFVSGMKLNLDTSGAKLAEYISKKVPLEPLGKAGVRVAGYDINDVTETVLNSVGEFRLKKNFQSISENHALLDAGWDDLVTSKALLPEQQRFLRTFFAQVKPENLEDLIITPVSRQEFKNIATVTGNSVFDEAVGIFGNTDAGDFTRGAVNGKPTIGVLEGFSQQKGSYTPYHVFLHEYGHAYHLAYLDDAAKLEIDGALADILENSTPEQIALLTGRNVRQSYNGAELFANAYAAWATGRRTSSAMLEKHFKRISDEFKTFRETMYTDAVNKVDGPRTSQLQDVFSESLQHNAQILNNLPSSARKAALTDLLDPIHTRRSVVEFAPNATESEVREALFAAGVERTALPPETLEFAENFLARSKYHLDSDKWWAKTIRTFDEIHSIYRTAFTQYFPAFHSRNLISNMFMNAMAGDVKTKHYLQALNKLRAMEPEEALYLGSLGVLDSGKIREVFEFMQDSRGGISEGMKKFIKRLPGGDEIGSVGRKIEAGTREGGHRIENFTRYAHYLAKKEVGLADSEASESVLKYLFDYQDLTDFERAVPRRSMLFYTFFRKNLPLMIEQTVKNPRFMQTYARATGQNNKNIVQPDWLPDSFFFGTDEQGRTIRANFGLPPEDLARFDPEGKGLSRVFELMISSLVPVIREPFQFVSGRDLFTGRPREGGVGEILASNLPTSRATGTVQRILAAASGDDPNLQLAPELLRTLTGIAQRPINEQIQKKMNELDMIRDRLDELVRAGRGRRIEIVGQRSANRDKPDPEIQELNSMQARILREIAIQGSK